MCNNTADCSAHTCERTAQAVYSALTAIIYAGRIIKMTKQTTNMTKGIGVGMALGAVAGAAGTWLMAGSKRQLKRNAKHAESVISDIAKNVGYMLKQ